jgi:hypothetical protein
MAELIEEFTKKLKSKKSVDPQKDNEALQKLKGKLVVVSNTCLVAIVEKELELNERMQSQTTEQIFSKKQSEQVTVSSKEQIVDSISKDSEEEKKEASGSNQRTESMVSAVSPKNSNN